MIDDEAVKAIENLHRLKGEGIITESEFEQSKQKILFGPRPARTSSPNSFPRLPAFNGDLPKEGDHVGWATLALRRYADFTGRSARQEFWMFVLLANVIVAALAVCIAVDTDSYGDIGAVGMLAIALLVIGLLGVLIPVLAVQVRRLHDQDRSGWLVLINLVPYVGAVVMLIFMALPGTSGDNRYGPDPLTT